jgi:hypothetical protein
MSIAASNPARPAPRSAGASAAAAAPRTATRATVAAPVASIRPAPSASARSSAPSSASAPMFAHLLGADTEEEILHLQLSDLPRMSTGLHVEGFKHTLLSRIFGLFTRR